MKLRLRFNKKTVVVTLDDKENSPKFGELKQQVKTQFNLTEFIVTLNGVDSLSEDDDVALQTVGLVSGDLLIIKSSQQVENVESCKSELYATQENNTPGPGATQTIMDDDHIEKKYGSMCQHDSQMPQPSTSQTQDSIKEVVMADLEYEECIKDAIVNRYLNEPMCVRDSTLTQVPEALQQAYTQNEVTSNHDAMCVLLHVLMNETGYSILGNVSSIPAHHKLPEGWKRNANYQLVYSHIMCPDFKFKLTLVPVCSMMVVYGMVEGMSIKYDIKLKSAEYVKALNKDACDTFVKLPKISNLFKDNISHPLLHRIRNEIGMFSPNSLMGLISELKMLILQNLDARNLLTVGVTCKEMKELVKDPSLWRRLYLKVYGRRQNNDLNQNWYMLYKEHFMLWKQMNNFIDQSMVVPQYFNRTHLPTPFMPVCPPGIIGGDSDRDPAFLGLIGGGPMPGAMPTRPRFDPVGPLPNQRFPPGRGGGIFEGGSGLRQPRPFGGFGPRFF